MLLSDYTQDLDVREKEGPFNKIALSFRSIATIDRLSPKFTRISELYLNHNQIRSLAGIEQFAHLRLLHLKFNLIGELSELLRIENRFQIISLNIRGNPVEKSEPLACSLSNLRENYFRNLKYFDIDDESEFRSQWMTSVLEQQEKQEFLGSPVRHKIQEVRQAVKQGSSKKKQSILTQVSEIKTNSATKTNSNDGGSSSTSRKPQNQLQSGKKRVTRSGSTSSKPNMRYNSTAAQTDKRSPMTNLEDEEVQKEYLKPFPSANFATNSSLAEKADILKVKPFNLEMAEQESDSAPATVRTAKFVGEESSQLQSSSQSHNNYSQMQKTQQQQRNSPTVVRGITEIDLRSAVNNLPVYSFSVYSPGVLQNIIQKQRVEAAIQTPAEDEEQQEEVRHLNTTNSEVVVDRYIEEIDGDIKHLTDIFRHKNLLIKAMKCFRLSLQRRRRQQQRSALFYKRCLKIKALYLWKVSHYESRTILQMMRKMGEKRSELVNVEQYRRKEFDYEK